MLDLAKYEEQIVGKILGDLARQEGVLNMTEIKFDGAAIVAEDDTDAVKK